MFWVRPRGPLIPVFTILGTVSRLKPAQEYATLKKQAEFAVNSAASSFDIGLQVCGSPGTGSFEPV
jgi:hypothetical protein